MAVIQHIAFNCVDVKRQEAFYTKFFGFRRSRVFNGGSPDEFVMLRLGGTRVEMFPAKAGPAVRGGEQGVGFKHLAFEVSDIDATVANLRADGFQTGEIIDCSRLVPNLRVCFLDDPEGNRLEIMAGYTDDPSL